MQCLEAVECRGKVAEIRDKVTVDDLSTGEEDVLKELITEFADVFSQGEHGAGYCEKVPHQIKLIENRSVRRLFRRIPVNQRDDVQTIPTINQTAKCVATVLKS